MRIGKTQLLDYLNQQGNEEVWQKFAELADEGNLTEAAFNVGLRYSWTMGRPDSLEEVEELFKKSDINLLMSSEEKAYYNNLPLGVTLYRGTSTYEIGEDNVEDGAIIDDEVLGFSWTTDIKVAEFFAFRGRHFPKEEGRLLSAYIDKENIKAIFLDRGESEALILPSEIPFLEVRVKETTPPKVLWTNAGLKN